MTQIEVARALFQRRGGRSGGALVPLLDDLLVEDLHAPHHPQAQVANDVLRERVVVDVITVDIEPESLPLQATAVGELHGEIETRTLVGHLRNLVVRESPGGNSLLLSLGRKWPSTGRIRTWLSPGPGM